MEVYVDVYNTSSPVLNISLERLRNSYIRAILTDPIVDLSKINGYFLTYKKEDNEYYVAFDQKKYEEYLKEKEKEGNINKGNELLNDIQEDLALKYATDEEAYIMRYLYDPWKADTKYEVGDRRLYKDNLYKCKQAHTSQAQHTPDLVPALWDIINGDSEKGTIDNPIIVPEVVSSMEYEYGKYYLEDTKIYLCKRAGVPNPESMYGQKVSLTFKPSQLIGHYFEIVEK